MAEKKAQSGRKAQTRGVSLSPQEAELVDRFAALTGLGLTDQVRTTVLRRLPAAVALLQEMKDAGMEIGAPGVEERVIYAESEHDRHELYEDSFQPEEVREVAGAGGH